jgi:hypothetical protein
MAFAGTFVNAARHGKDPRTAARSALVENPLQKLQTQ